LGQEVEIVAILSGRSGVSWELLFSIRVGGPKYAEEYEKKGG